jgi:hypothetical protein
MSARSSTDFAMPAPRLSSNLAPAARVRTLGVIRVALLAGVLAFGGVTWLMRRRGAASAPADVAPLRVMLIVMWTIAVSGIVTFRVLFGRAHDAARRAQLSIFGWAAGELPALIGGVYYFMTGDAAWYAAGVLLLVAAFVVFPLRP